jgi:hypothetical protein
MSSVSLLELLRREFPLLAEVQNLEDAFHEVAVVDLAIPHATSRDVRHALAWLQYELGLVREKPEFPKPYEPAGESLVRGSFLREIDQALEADRSAA